MRLHETLLALLGFITLIHALALPASLESLSEASKDLFKRKGGGGGGGRGGGGSSGSSSGGSKGGSSGSTGSSSSSGSKGLTGSTSNTGGATRSGSGVTRGFGGGAYYGGGASTPYRAGATRGGIGAPLLLGAAGLAVFPGLWLGGAYLYHYPGYYNYRNETNNQNETRPVECLCAENAECGCDANNNTDYLTAVANNNTISRVANINGTDTLVINGTLPNGTTAPGGNDSAAPSLKQGMLEMSGLWIVVAGVVYTVYGM